MAIFTKQSDIDTLKEAGRRLAFVLDEVAEKIAPGVTEKELDAEARRLIEKGGDTPAFLGYTPRGAEKPYPATLCVSVNDAVVHGIPTDRPLREGDVVALDIGLVHDGVVVDMAKTYLVGVVSDEIKNRLSWFETEVSPTIEFYKNHPKHTFFDINGEQTLEEVAREIQTKLNGNF